MVGPPRFYPPYTNDHAFYICVSSLREGVKKIDFLGDMEKENYSGFSKAGENVS